MEIKWGKITVAKEKKITVAKKKWKTSHLNPVTNYQIDQQVFQNKKKGKTRLESRNGESFRKDTKATACNKEWPLPVSNQQKR